MPHAVFSLIITDCHPDPLFSVCIISQNAEWKIIQANCVRKAGAVLFGDREIIRGTLKRAKSTYSIVKTRSIIKPKTSCIIKNNATCFSFTDAACFTCVYPLVKHFPHIFYWLVTTMQKHHNKILNLQFPSLISDFGFRFSIGNNDIFATFLLFQLCHAFLPYSLR